MNNKAFRDHISQQCGFNKAKNMTKESKTDGANITVIATGEVLTDVTTKARHNELRRLSNQGSYRRSVISGSP